MKLKVLVLFSLLCLNSCSMIKIGYSIADWYIKKEILTYVKLYTKQQELLEGNLDDYMAWHKKVMIPRYIRRIDDMKILIKSTDFKDKKQLSALLNKVSYTLRKEFIDTFIPLAQTTVKPFSTLGDEQIQRSRELFAKKFTKDVEKRKKYTEEEAIYLWQENTKDWLGLINIEQKKWLENNKSKLLFKNLSKEKMAKRGERNKTFLDIFDEKNPEKRIELQNLYWEQFSKKILTQDINSDFEKVITQYLSLTNAQQKDFLISKLNYFKKEIDKLK